MFSLLIIMNAHADVYAVLSTLVWNVSPARKTDEINAYFFDNMTIDYIMC